MAPTQSRDAHNAPVCGDDLRRSRQARTHPGGTEDPAAGDGSFQPRNPRDDRDALRVRGALRGGSLQVRRGVRRASYAAEGGDRRDGTLVRQQASGRRYSSSRLEAVMNSISNGLGMRNTGTSRKPNRPWNPHFYAIFTQVHNTL